MNHIIIIIIVKLVCWSAIMVACSFSKNSSESIFHLIKKKKKNLTIASSFDGPRHALVVTVLVVSKCRTYCRGRKSTQENGSFKYTYKPGLCSRVLADKTHRKLIIMCVYLRLSDDRIWQIAGMLHESDGGKSNLLIRDNLLFVSCKVKKGELDAK